MKNTFSLLILLFVIQFSFSQTLSPTLKHDPGINYERLSRVDTVMNQYINQKWLNGAVVIIVKDNQVAYYKGYGYDDKSNNKPMQKDAIFRIMSQSKAITSLALMQLFERGQLLLDENISDFIPEFKNPKVLNGFNSSDSSYTTIPAKRGITFRIV